MTVASPAASTARTYEVRAETTATFGRVEVAVRQHTLTIDGPVQNGCPGEAPTPGEMFLSGAAACGAEVLQVLARDNGVPLERVEVTVRGTIDRERQPHQHVTVFSDVDLHLRLAGPTDEQAATLVAGFQRRCPVYGSLAIASALITVRFDTVPAS